MSKKGATIAFVVPVSVVIPAFNEEENIAKTLDSLVLQDTNTPFEVIVVDNASTDNTSTISRSYTKKLNLKVILENKKGRGKARARGFEEADGEIIFSMDADTIPPTDWIKNMLHYFEDPKVIAVTGPWRVEDVEGFTKWFLNNCQMPAMLPYLLLRRHYWLTGFNFAISKRIYQKVGGFNTKINAHEDIDLTERIRKYGKIIYAKNCKVITSGRRYKDGIVKGLWAYQGIGIRYFVFGDKSIILDDQR